MEWSVLIGAVCAIFGAVLGYLGFSRDKAREDRQTGRETGAVMTELGYIKSSVDGVGKKIDRLEDVNLKNEGRLSAVEASAKQAHKRLDRIEGREDHSYHEEH